jgi:uncharacterized protein YmfQ (DUF2313 family)
VTAGAYEDARLECTFHRLKPRRARFLFFAASR